MISNDGAIVISLVLELQDGNQHILGKSPPLFHFVF